jgi:hypothetical protein
MLSRTRALLVVATASLTLAAASNSAFAEKFTISPAGSITATSLGSFVFRSPAVNVSCPITLSGTLQSAAAVFGEAGAVTSVRGTEACRGATVRADATPWTIVVGGWLGTLPSGLTGIRADIYNAGFLFNVNILGIEAKCDYFGKISTLAPLSSSRTGLLTIQSSEDRLELDESLGMAGLCPSASEVSFSGTLSPTTQTVTAAKYVLDPSPESPVFFAASGTTTVTIRNISGVTQRIRRVILSGSSAYVIDSQNCLIGMVTEMAANTTCTIRVRYTSQPDRLARIAQVRLLGDPSETWLGGFSATNR